MLSRLHASLLFVRVAKDSDWSKVSRLVQAQATDGWLLVGPVTDQIVGRFAQWNCPSVIVGDHQCTQPVHAVKIDHFALGRMGAERLGALGHRRIGYLGGRFVFPYQQETLAGFRAAVRERGLDEDERLIVRSSLGNWLADLDPRPTALFVAEPGPKDPRDLLADLGVAVPGDMNVLASELTADSGNTASTRLVAPMDDVGRQGALLLHKVATESGLSSSQLKVAPVFLPGSSTCPPRARGAQGPHATERTSPISPPKENHS